jgi:RNA polymerase sigma-70 factor (ECF subfamily)
MINAPLDELVTRARAGDADAFTAIYDQYRGDIYSLAYRLMADADDAHDMTQDTFASAHQAIGRTAEELNISAWLHRIATNKCLDVLRRRQRLRWLPWEGPKHDHLLLGPRADDPEDATISHETRVAVLRALQAMTPRHRRALILREFDGLDCTEIGEVMGLSRSAVKSMLFRAREEFRRRWNGDAPPPRAPKPVRVRVVSPFYWTDAAIAELWRRTAAGQSDAEISQAMGKSEGAIQNKRQWLRQSERARPIPREEAMVGD